MITINKNTYLSELYAWFLLSDNVLNNRSVTIGDDIPNGLPDIYTNDKKIGIEVSTIEEKHVYQLLSTFRRIKNQRAEDFCVKNMKFDEKKLKMAKPNTSANNIFSVKPIQKAKEKSSREGIEKALNHVIRAKLDRLNYKNSYSACENVFLFLDSDSIKKDFISVNDYAKIYSDIAGEYQKQFDGLFVSLNNKLYFVNQHNRINIIKKASQVQKVRKETRLVHLEQAMEL